MSENEKPVDDSRLGSSHCYPAFDDWYQEILGFSLRAEYMTGPVDELRAAFEAGRMCD